MNSPKTLSKTKEKVLKIFKVLDKFQPTCPYICRQIIYSCSKIICSYLICSSSNNSWLKSKLKLPVLNWEGKKRNVFLLHENVLPYIVFSHKYDGLLSFAVSNEKNYSYSMNYNWMKLYFPMRSALISLQC